MATSPPKNEQGSSFHFGGAKIPLGAGFTQGGPTGANAYWDLLDDSEYVADWKFPASRTIVDKMRNDPQVHGLWMGMTMPIRRYKWMIDRNGAKQAVTKRLAEELNLPIKGQEKDTMGRTANRFSHDDHLAHALLALAYGFMFFEQVGDTSDGQAWKLRKLGPRMPHSIVSILTDRRDGGLAGIRQQGILDPILVNRLVAYVWQREGANWYGRSMFRPLYKSWFIKDKLIRVDLIKHERNGMGVPTAKQTHPDATPAQLKEAERLANAWRAGQGASASLPWGTDVELKGVSGSLPDTLASIKYHDESMARAMLMMFMMLGQTESGSRALGDTMVDFFSLAQEAIADWYVGVTNAHVIEDWVDWNYGENEPCPRLTYVREFDRSYSVADLVSLISAGAVRVDDEVENFLRVEGGLPKIDPNAPPVAPVSPPTAPGPTPEVVPTRRAHVARTALSLPERDLRREPSDPEMTAGVNFKLLDDTYQATVGLLVEKMKAVREMQMDELHEKIMKSNLDLDVLANLDAPVLGADDLYEELEKVTSVGVQTALAEARFQNVQVEDLEITDLLPEVEARSGAVATTLSRSLSEAASRKAVALAGGSLTASEVADAVAEHISSLSDRYLEDQLTGAVTQAQNSGRRWVMETTKPEKIVASELLDTNTCVNCAAIDGTEYANTTEAAKDYPTGGFKDCLGGPRCRGITVAIYKT